MIKLNSKRLFDFKTHLDGVIAMANNNKLLVPGAENAMNNMKQEIANEFGVQLGADTTARANGSVGGEMVKRMIKVAEQSLNENNNNQ